MKHPAPTYRGLIGPEHVTDTGETFRWKAHNLQPQRLRPGSQVKVLVDEGGLRRGRRLFHCGATGTVLHAHKAHERGWLVRVNEVTVLLFDDEIEEIPVAGLCSGADGRRAD